MKKFYLIPIDLDLETGMYSNLTTEQIKNIIIEYCEDEDIFIIDAIPYNEAPTPERFKEMVDLSEELHLDDILRFVDIHVSIDGIDYSAIMNDDKYKLLCTESIYEDLCLDRKKVKLIDKILN